MQLESTSYRNRQMGPWDFRHVVISRRTEQRPGHKCAYPGRRTTNPARQRFQTSTVAASNLSSWSLQWWEHPERVDWHPVSVFPFGRGFPAGWARRYCFVRIYYSRQNPFHYVGLFHSRELFLESVLLDEEFLVAHAEQVQYGCMPVANAHAVLDGVQTQLIGCTISDAALNTPSSHPGAEGIFVMVAAGLAFIFIGRKLSDRQPTKFPAPDDECSIEQAPLL